jgi:hypothetical protein
MSKFVKKYLDFVNEGGGGAPAPAEPKVKPTVKPGKPVEKPRPNDPIRRDKPSVDPRPKAKATAEAVADRFMKELKNLGNTPVDGLDVETLKKRYKK